MAARASVVSLLEGDPVLAGLGFSTVYGSNAVDTPEEDKFIILRWEEEDQQIQNHGPQRLSVWLHDRDQDYAAIDKGLRRIRHLLDGAVHVEGADGWILTCSDWRGDSQDLVDDGFGTQTRNAAFDVVSRMKTTV